MKGITALVVALGLVLSAVSGASAATHTRCSGANPLPPGTYENVTAEGGCRLNSEHVIRGTLVVYAQGGDGGASEVDGTRIGGDLVVYGGGNITNAHVEGGVFFLGGYYASIHDSYVGDVIWNRAGFGAMSVVGNTVGGDIILDGAGSDEVVASDNVVAGNFSVMRFAGNFTIDGNRVAGNFRVTDADPYNPGPSTISDNHVGRHFEVARLRLAIFPETPAGLEPVVMVADNVVEGHAGIFEAGTYYYPAGNARDVPGVRVSHNKVAGALLCLDNRDLVARDNVAHPLLGECSD